MQEAASMDGGHASTGKDDLNECLTDVNLVEGPVSSDPPNFDSNQQEEEDLDSSDGTSIGESMVTSMTSSIRQTRHGGGQRSRSPSPDATEYDRSEIGDDPIVSKEIASFNLISEHNGVASYDVPSISSSGPSKASPPRHSNPELVLQESKSNNVTTASPTNNRPTSCWSPFFSIFCCGKSEDSVPHESVPLPIEQRSCTEDSVSKDIHKNIINEKNKEKVARQVKHSMEVYREAAGGDRSSDPELRMRKQEEHAIRIFNDSPKKGVAEMIRLGMMGVNLTTESSPAAVASFLHSHPLHKGISKVKIGEYLSDPDPVCKAALTAYCSEFSFQDQTIDMALRNFLSGFRLAGEAQKVDRVMQAFSQRYWDSNRTILEGTLGFAEDTSYVLAFSVIMLNTDAHSPQLKNKKRMTKEQFITNTRGIGRSGGSLPRGFLEALYDRILENEIKLQGDELQYGNDVTFVDPVIEGDLVKMRSNGTLKKFRCVVTDNCLYYFTTGTYQKGDRRFRCQLPLTDLKVDILPGSRHSFALTSTKRAHFKMSKRDEKGELRLRFHKKLAFQAENEDDLHRWVSALQSETASVPVTPSSLSGRGSTPVLRSATPASERTPGSDRPSSIRLGAWHSSAGHSAASNSMNIPLSVDAGRIRMGSVASTKAPYADLKAQEKNDIA